MSVGMWIIGIWLSIVFITVIIFSIWSRLAGNLDDTNLEIPPWADDLSPEVRFLDQE